MRILYLLFLLLFPACSSEGPTIDVEGFEKITLARTGCYGFCPTYEVTIHADGLVVYQGYEHVGVLGERQSTATPEGIAELIQACQQLNFFELEAKYEYKFDEDGQPYSITDQPSRIMTLTVKGKSKVVEEYFGGPEALRALAERIDAIAGTAAWTKKAEG
jgi:Domain of unknown function (DUF6438)